MPFYDARLSGVCILLSERFIRLLPSIRSRPASIPSYSLSKAARVILQERLLYEKKYQNSFNYFRHLFFMRYIHNIFIAKISRLVKRYIAH